MEERVGKATLVSEEVTVGPPRVVLFNQRTRAWEFNRETGPRFRFDEDYQERSKPVPRGRAERIAQEDLGVPLPSEAELDQMTHGSMRMAILLDFQKIREDPGEVEYVFGYPEMNRHLVVRKESREGTPLDGGRDKDFAAVFSKIRRYHTSEGTWPEKGTYAA